MDTTTILQALKAITADPSSLSGPESAQLSAACTAFASATQSVELKLMDLIFAPIKTTTIRLAIDIGLFDAAIEASSEKGGGPLKTLSDKTGAEALLIKRILRVLIAGKLFVEIDQDVFQPTPLAAIYTSASPMAQILIHMTTAAKSIIALPDYFAEKGYTSPTDSLDCPFQYATGTKLHNFDWIAANPRIQQAFNVMMTIRTQRSIDAPWFEIYPIEELIATSHSSQVFLVDVGGGVGHQIIDLKKHYPKVGRMIVEDIEAVTKTIQDLPDGIERSQQTSSTLNQSKAQKSTTSHTVYTTGQTRKPARFSATSKMPWLPTQCCY